MDKQVRDKLRKYKRFIDWVDIFDGNIESGMGMSYEGISVKSNENNSDVERKVIQREKHYKEYKNKLAYIHTIEAILDKLTDYERQIIEMKFNLYDEDRFKKYQVGEVPNDEIYNDPEFPLSRTRYYQIKKSAFRKLQGMMKLLR